MWNPFTYANLVYLLKIERNELSFYVSDLDNIWIKSFNRNDLLEQFTANNPLFDSKNDEETLNYLLNIINNTDNIIGLKQTENTIEIDVKAKIDDLPIKFSFLLYTGTSETLRQEITVPLIKTVHYLELKNRHLEKLLQAKDKEIKEYNLEYGGEITRKDLITPKYENADQKVELPLHILLKINKFKAFFDKYGELEHNFLEEQPPKKRKLSLPKMQSKRRK